VDNENGNQLEGKFKGVVDVVWPGGTNQFWHVVFDRKEFKRHIYSEIAREVNDDTSDLHNVVRKRRGITMSEIGMDQNWVNLLRFFGATTSCWDDDYKLWSKDKTSLTSINKKIYLVVKLASGVPAFLSDGENFFIRAVDERKIGNQKSELEKLLDKSIERDALKAFNGLKRLGNPTATTEMVSQQEIGRKYYQLLDATRDFCPYNLAMYMNLLTNTVADDLIRYVHDNPERKTAATEVAPSPATATVALVHARPIRTTRRLASGIGYFGVWILGGFLALTTILLSPRVNAQDIPSAKAPVSEQLPFPLHNRHRHQARPEKARDPGVFVLDRRKGLRAAIGKLGQDGRDELFDWRTYFTDLTRRVALFSEWQRGSDDGWSLKARWIRFLWKEFAPSYEEIEHALTAVEEANRVRNDLVTRHNNDPKNWSLADAKALEEADRKRDESIDAWDSLMRRRWPNKVPMPPEEFEKIYFPSHEPNIRTPPILKPGVYLREGSSA
jgi:hypothetical protein